MKCRTCKEELEPSWQFCEICGKKTNNTDVIHKNIVKNEIIKKVKKKETLQDLIHKQSNKVTRVSTNVTQFGKKTEVDPKTTLIEARAKAAAKAREDDLEGGYNPTDVHIEKMVSFLKEHNHSTMERATKLAKSPRRKSKMTKSARENQMSSDFFKSQLDVKTSQNFNSVQSRTKTDSYLDCEPSLLEIFDDPSLLKPITEDTVSTNREFGEIVKRRGFEPRLVADGTDRRSKEDHNEAHTEEAKNSSKDKKQEPEIFFWGSTVKDQEDPETSGDNGNEDDDQQHTSLQKSVRKMKLFQGGYWGKQESSDQEEENKNENNNANDNDNDNDVLSDEDDNIEFGGSNALSSIESAEDESIIIPLAITDSTTIADIFDHLQIDLSHFNNEKGRRYMANLYRSSMRHMNDAIARGTIAFSKDPIHQSRPVSIYKRLECRLKNVINEGEMCVRAADELYRMCHEDSKFRRMDVVARLDAENKRAAAVRHKYSVKYAKITNKENVDVYTLEMAQNRIREKADKELDAIRIKVNDLLKEETDLIMKIKSEERALELTVVMYSTKHLRLLEQTQVTYQSVISMKRYLAVRVIQRNVRFYLLPSSVFTLGHIATPWFRSLLRQQQDEIRQQQKLESRTRKYKKKAVKFSIK